jgi:hypothetical protein
LTKYNKKLGLDFKTMRNARHLYIWTWTIHGNPKKNKNVSGLHGRLCDLYDHQGLYMAI